MRVVIAGGGTAGWLSACALSTRLGSLLDITLVESEAIGTIGVGEATIPPIRNFHRIMDIDEQAFMRATQATFKLGIVFDNWGAIGDSYIHSFGEIGRRSWMAEFHEFWLEARDQGFGGSLDEYCLELMAAKAGRFAKNVQDTRLNFAFHIDATRYAAFLRQLSEAAGVKRVEGKIREVRQHAQTGAIEALVLDSGASIEGDLFIDCTGFRALLIGDALGVGVEDWSHWLAADRAIAVQTEASEPPPPYTRAIAHAAGWQWRIPLQNRVGNGIVYSSRFLADDEARDTLLHNLSGAIRGEPRLLRFGTGRRSKAWEKNCVAMGLAGGFVEPLESTSIHLVMTGIFRLIRLFPFGEDRQALARRFNEETRVEMEAVRDFIILHYRQTKRRDSDFWNACRTMDIPDSLAERMELFRNHAYVWSDDVTLFRVASWVQVMMGQGIDPGAHHRAGRLMDGAALKRSMGEISDSIAEKLQQMPTHQAFIERYCRAPAEAFTTNRHKGRSASR